jgi:phospholipase C
VLDRAASECGIDTVVVVVMENRSFDHYLGWLARDTAYLDDGRRRYGATFAIDGRVHQVFPDPSGNAVATRPAASLGSETVETRGCTYRSPGHGWREARLERDHGFLAPGTGNDEFALVYYAAEDIPLYAALARRFTVFDHWHSSLLGPTFPNRQYLLSGESEGWKGDPVPLRSGVFSAETIFERLAAAGASSACYNTDLPLLALWGADRMAPFVRSLDRYFEDAASSRLPNVSFVDPSFSGALRTDDHPRGDVTLGQRWIREVFRAFVESAHWQRGAFVVVYDENGGFFDHVRPPVLPDPRASRLDKNNFGQAGFRVPALLASPFALPGAVDHRVYDHTSILRFLEWRFLGAPPEGRGTSGGWSLTLRDRSARNMGRTLTNTAPNPELGFDLAMRIPPPLPACTPGQKTSRPRDRTPDPFERAPELEDLEASRFPGATHKPWLADLTSDSSSVPR